MKDFKKVFWIILIFILFLAGCESDPVEPTQTPLEEKTSEEATATATSEPVAEAPLPTSAPTARPLVDAEDPDPGQYLNDLYGVEVLYPSRWELLDSDQTGPTLLAVRDSSEQLVVIFQTYLKEEDQTLDDFNVEFMEIVVGELEMEVTDEPIFETYSLREEITGLKMVQYGLSQGANWVIDLISVESSGRMYVFITFGAESSYQSRATMLAEMHTSINFYSASPYGVTRENAIFLSSGEPRTLDPALMQTNAASIMGDLFSGVVRLDTNLRPIPDLAEDWEVSEDGLVYTFYLRKDVLFHSGRAFTAQDVVFSWERATDPELESPTTPTYLIDIKGVQEKLDGEADQISGLKMIDDYTIEVTLDAPKAYFLAKLAYPTSWIVDSETVDDIEDNPIGTGPFKMVKHEEDEIIILERNENYYGGFVQLEYIVYLLYQGYSIRMYEGGQIDMVGVTEDMLERAESPDDPLYGSVQSASALCTFYVLFDNSKAPFDDPKVREAFGRAIDKERYRDIMTEGKGVIANGVLPPGMPGYSPDIKPLEYNEELALQALADSAYGSSEALPQITFTARGFGAGLGPDVGYFIQVWQDLFGITITVDQIQPTDYWDEVQAGNHGNIVNLGWCADYPDPENFLDLLFHSEADLNVSKFNNAEFDALLEAARVESDIATRLFLYQQAEQILVDEAGGIFLSHSQASYLVTKPYIKGFVNTPIGVAQMMNVYIERGE